MVRVDLFKTVALACCVGIWITFISTNLHGRFDHHSEVVSNQLAILKGEPLQIDGATQTFPQFQSRILFPAMLTGLARLRFATASQWYIALRLLTAIAAFGVFMLAVQAQGSPKAAWLGGIVLGYGIVFTFNHPWEHPTDFLDILAFSTFVYLTLRKARAAMFAALIVASLNHQTAAFAGVLWLCVWWGPIKEVLFAGLLIVTGLAIPAAILRLYGGGHYPIDGWRTWSQLIEAIRHPNPFSWPIFLIAMFLPSAFWLRSNRSKMGGWGDPLARTVAAAIVIVVLSTPLAFWAELRSVFLAPLVLVTFAAAGAESRTCEPLGFRAT